MATKTAETKTASETPANPDLDVKEVKVKEPPPALDVPLGVIVRWNLDLHVAKQLYNTACKDETRDLLYNTVRVDNGEDGAVAFIATDTHRLFWAEEPAKLARTVLQRHNPYQIGVTPPGLYRWVQPPTMKLQLLERIELEFPDWRRVTKIAEENLIGCYKWRSNNSGHIYFCKPTAFELKYLPQGPFGDWSIYRNETTKDNRGEVINPMLFRAGNYRYILMPIDATNVFAPREYPVP